jgi:hypothetical protein
VRQRGIFEIVTGLPVFRQSLDCLLKISYKRLEYSPSHTSFSATFFEFGIAGLTKPALDYVVPDMFSLDMYVA